MNFQLYFANQNINNNNIMALSAKPPLLTFISEREFGGRCSSGGSSLAYGKVFNGVGWKSEYWIAFEEIYRLQIETR